MNICVVGLGRLGGPFATCWAKKGHSVIGVDKNEEILNNLKNRVATVSEAGMQEILDDPNIKFELSDNIAESVMRSDVTFVLVSTPSTASGRFSEANVINVCKEVGRGLEASENRPIVVVASTVSPKTIDEMIIPTLEESSGLKCVDDFGVCHIPEWVALGELINGFLNPDITLIGESDEESGKVMESLYKEFLDNEPPIIHTSLLNAEISKVALNAYIATKITFANTIAQICERLPGADADIVTSTIGLDKRIGTKFFKGATAYGGPCLKPDAIVQTESGPKKISSLVEGEKVFSHDGKLHKITEVMSRRYDGEIIEITPAGFSKSPIIATPEHPVWVSKKITGDNRIYRTISASGKTRLAERKGIGKEEFLPISEISMGDMVLIPKIKIEEKIPSEILLNTHHLSPVKEKTKISPDLMRIFGLYLAEGSTWKKEIKFSFHVNEISYFEDVKNVIYENFGVKTKIKNIVGKGMHTRTTCSPLASFLRNTFGKSSHTKKVPEEWLYLPEEHLIELLKGLWFGDGSDSGNAYTFGTTSFNLFNFVKMAFLRLGIAFRTKIYPPRTDKNNVKHRKAYHILVSNEPYVSMLNEMFEGNMKVETKGSGKKTIWFEKENMMCPVKKIEKKNYTGLVYNLEVEDSHSYMLESSVVHNCFPRDIKAMKALLNDVDEPTFLPMAVHEMNKIRTQALAKLIKRQTKGKTAGILGLTFKPNTAVVEESPSIWLINELKDRCQMMCAYDPEGETNLVIQPKNIIDFLAQCDTIVIMTPWDEFKKIDPQLFANKKVIDCWRILDPDSLPESTTYIPLGKHSGA